MKEPSTIVTHCVVCSKELSMRDRDILFLSDFNQSWCEICTTKHIESYPSTNDKEMQNLRCQEFTQY